MDVKYTFRDLVVYLLTGFFCAFMINLTNPSLIKDFLQLDYLKDKDVTILVIAIPILYIFGHIVQMIDLLFSFYIVNFLKKFKEGNWLKKIVYKLSYTFFASTTAEYHRERLGLTEDEHILQKFIVMVHDKNNNAGYYYLMKELFSGIKSFLLIYFFYVVYIKNWKLLFFTTILLILVWLKAYNSSNNYIWALTNTYTALNRKLKD
jgi:hypothetical protein